MITLKLGKVLKIILALNSNKKERNCVTIDTIVIVQLELTKDIHSNITPLTYVNNVNYSIGVFDVSCVEVLR